MIRGSGRCVRQNRAGIAGTPLTRVASLVDTARVVQYRVSIYGRVPGWAAALCPFFLFERLGAGWAVAARRRPLGPFVGWLVSLTSVGNIPIGDPGSLPPSTSKANIPLHSYPKLHKGLFS
jgi:hypothetical protein